MKLMEKRDVFSVWRRGAAISVVLALATIGAEAAVPTHNNVSYGPESRQWLDIYQVQSAEPTPVYIWSHSNGSTADSVPNGILDPMAEIGVTVISWESVETLSTITEVETSWADADLMFAWVKANASVYNLDMNNIIIGGASRGTGASWKLANSLDPGIRGVYMKNALPDPFWAFPSVWDPASDVTVDSPPLYFTYLPYPGEPGDIHDPENGMIIEDRYQALGIGDRMTLVHSLNLSSNSDPWQFLKDFVLAVLDDSGDPPPPAADLFDDFEGSNMSYTWSESPTSWELSGGAYVQGDSSAYGKSYTGDSLWTDYTFSAEMATLESFDSAKGWMTGLLAFRVSDPDNMYLVRMNQNGNVLLMSMVGGTRSTLASIGSGLSPYDNHVYSITAGGSSIQVSVDGNQLIDVTNNDHSSGYIGLRTDKSSAVYDNVSVITADDPQPISFSDDYNNGFNSGYYTALSGTWVVDPTNQNLRVQENNLDGLIVTGQSDWQDYTMTARFKTFGSSDPAINWYVARLVTRYTDPQNFYEAYVKLDGVLMVKSYVDGAATTLLSTSTSVNPLIWNTMSITVDGSSITVSLNGEAFETLTNTDHSQGQAGFLSKKCKGRYDDLVISGN